MKKPNLTISTFFIYIILQFFLNTELLQAQTKTGDDKNTDVSTTVQKSIIFFENPGFNFGKIYKGKKVEHIFKFENRGNDTLKIKRVRSSCGCTAAILTNDTIPPGKTGEIKATFKSGAYRGNIKKSIYVLSNDPDTRNHKLTISGEVIEDISIKPGNINFGTINANKQSEREVTVTVKSQSDPDFIIKKITSSKPFVDASITVVNHGEHIINVLFKGYHKIGRFSGKIFLETNSTKQKQVTIPFFGEIAGDISIYPKKIYFGSFWKEREPTRKLFVKLNEDNIKILNIKLSPDFLSYIIEEKYEQDNPHCIIEIKLHKEAPIGKLNGLLEIYTNSQKQPLIKMPITGMIKKNIKSNNNHGA